ncbi:MAG: Gfo/Idh/MocA family protein [Chthoniobacteraceae bacterium]
MGETTYGLGAQVQGGEIPAPDLPYRPPAPARRDVPIGLIGCGGISQVHLRAYAAAGLNVVALASRSVERAEARRAEFYPDAAVLADFRELLARSEIEVVDITTSPEVRGPFIEAALNAGKHVLSQKPFVVDLAEGERLVRLAEEKGLQLAVNQNGRWAPHFAYMLAAVRAGLIGEVSSVDLAVHWDHHWVLGSAFEDVQHLVLEDFGIHWFDIAAAAFGGRKPRSVYAAEARSSSQRARPPFLAHAIVEWENGQATLQFNADCTYGQEDRTTIMGTEGTLRSVGPSLTEQTVTLYTAEGWARPALEGSWMLEGFQGTMLELLCAIEEKRAPTNSARENLRSLRLCQAAVRSAETEARVAL